MLALLVACASETQLVPEPPAIADAWQPDGDCGPWWPYEREGLELVYEGFDTDGNEVTRREVMGAPGIYQGVLAFPVHVTIPRGWNTQWVTCDQGSAWALGWGDSAPECIDSWDTASGLFTFPVEPGLFWSATATQWRFDARWNKLFWIGTCDNLVLVEGWEAIGLDIEKGPSGATYTTPAGTFSATELRLPGATQWVGEGVGWLVRDRGATYFGLPSGGPPFTDDPWLELVEVIEP